MMNLSQHATLDGEVINVCNTLQSFLAVLCPVITSKHVDTANQYQQALQTVVELNQPAITLIETEMVFVHHHSSCDAGSRTCAAPNLQTQTAGRTGLFATITRSKATNWREISLATFVLGPITAGVDMVQCLVSNLHLCTKARKGTAREQTTARFFARGLQHINVEFLLVVQVFEQFLIIGRFGDHLLGDGLIISTRFKAACHDFVFFFSGLLEKI
mmetsp:Transcript_10999/g.16613  ORF Transcript_10999/g.16613 Transcript_10999/m.16613 type:complete len:216 (+) Transcript_10999:302-949(+)